MELTWYGLSCFRITERNFATVVTDPYANKIGLTLPKVKGDIVTISHDAIGHNNAEAVNGANHVLNGPGEYEIGGVFIMSTALFNEGVRNVHFSYDFDGLRVAHLGDLPKVPTQAQIEALGSVNILLLPIGGGTSLNAVQAAEVVSMLEPNIVLPMHYAMPDLKITLDPLERFMQEMGITEYEEENSLKISQSSLPEETQAVILTPRL